MDIILDLNYSKSEISYIANCVKEAIKDHKWIAFKGEVGAGKTSLIKELCKVLGYHNQVDSPTFSIVNSYDCKVFSIHHFDFYRIEHIDELEAIGYSEYLNSKDFVFIEWPENAMEALNESFLIVVIKSINDGKARNIKLLKI